MIDNYFDKIDSDIKAYLLGFFIADGCISKNSRCTNSYRFSINISDIDREILEIYKSELMTNNKIVTSHYKKGAINRKPVSCLRWTSGYMFEMFKVKYNINPNKTKDFNFTFNFELIDEEYYFSFIRGFFDGDGHISYTDTNQFTFAFYATSKPFLEQIGKIFEKEFDIEYLIKGTIKTNIELFCLRFNCNQKRKYFIKKLYDKFYSNSKFSLLRKKLKFEKYLNTVLNSNGKKLESV